MLKKLFNFLFVILFAQFVVQAIVVFSAYKSGVLSRMVRDFGWDLVVRSTRVGDDSGKEYGWKIIRFGHSLAQDPAVPSAPRADKCDDPAFEPNVKPAEHANVAKAEEEDYW